MAINNVITDDWSGHSHGEVEEALKDKLSEMSHDIEEAAQAGYAPPTEGIPYSDLAKAVRDTLDSVSDKVDKVNGKGLSTEDFTSEFKAKLEGLGNYDDTQIRTAVATLQSTLDGLATVATSGSYNDLKDRPVIPADSVVDNALSDSSENAVQNKVVKAAIDGLQNALNALIGGNVQGAIDTFNEVTAFLNGIDTDDPTLASQLLALNNAISYLQTALATKANDNEVVKSISVNGQTQTPTNGNVNITVSGAKGDDGKSAYEVAVANGFSGTQAQWLASLKGETGEQGATGPQGAQGNTGVNAENNITSIQDLANFPGTQDTDEMAYICGAIPAKNMNDTLSSVKDSIGLSLTTPTGLETITGKRIQYYVTDEYSVTSANHNIVQTLSLKKGETVIFTTSGLPNTYVAIAQAIPVGSNTKYRSLVKGNGGTNTKYTYTADADINLAFCYVAANGYTLSVQSCVVNKDDFTSMKESLATLGNDKAYISSDASLAINVSQTKYNALWDGQPKLDNATDDEQILRKGGVYEIKLSGNCRYSSSAEYLRLYLYGLESKKTKTILYESYGDTFSAQTLKVYPSEDSYLRIDARFTQTLTIKVTGIYSETLNHVIPSQLYPTIFGEETWLRFRMQGLKGRHDLSWHNGELWSFNRQNEGSAYIADAANATVKTLSLNMTETWQDATTNALQWKSVDWHFNKNLLLVGNGQQSYSANDSYCYIFYEADSWKAMEGQITFDNCGEYKRIDFTSLGKKCYGYWGDDAGADTMLVSVNLFADIYLVQLGKGGNNLSTLTGGGGLRQGETFVAAASGKYNGTWVVLNHWHQSEYAGAQSDHGGQYYGGYLYLGDNAYRARVYRIKLNDDGTMRWDILRFRFRQPNGSGDYNSGGSTDYYVDGVCAKDGKLYCNILSNNSSLTEGTAVADL